MNKKMVIAGRITDGKVEITDHFGDSFVVKPGLPPGCIGLAFAFESKKAAREYYKGIKDEHLIEIRYCD